MWAEVSSSALHLLHNGLSDSPIRWRCLLRVLCPVRRPITSLGCVLLKDRNLALTPRQGPEINSRAYQNKRSLLEFYCPRQTVACRSLISTCNLVHTVLRLQTQVHGSVLSTSSLSCFPSSSYVPSCIPLLSYSHFVHMIIQGVQLNTKSTCTANFTALRFLIWYV